MRNPLVTHCYCCNQPATLVIQNMDYPGIAPKWLVTCSQPKAVCPLGGATLTDISYLEEVADHRVTQHPDWQPISACTAG